MRGGVLRTTGTDVALTLASAVAPADAVTLGYGGIRLRDTEGRAVAAFTGLRVSNPPRLTEAAVDGAARTLTFDMELDPGAAPAASAFAGAGEHERGESCRDRAGGALGRRGHADPGGGGGDGRGGDGELRAAGRRRRGPSARRVGNEVAGFSEEAVKNETPVRVRAVEVGPDAGPNGASIEGETVTETVTFTSAVRVELE